MMFTLLICSVAGGHGVAPIGIIPVIAILEKHLPDSIWFIPVLLFLVGMSAFLVALVAKQRKQIFVLMGFLSGLGCVITLMCITEVFLFTLGSSLPFLIGVIYFAPRIYKMFQEYATYKS
ncbi:hypothetical protein SAMN05216480_10360 [Pustulibacterium marinum]|uniref:Uncharacterized protein n=2 Tax=Pustulibacterium marinum TaxID=1224947 RepID=A0A1I7G1G1_9FLAO|nr:hypothetical protein SAMN05216480_10360 [Pustulibacterium marinum]